MKLERRRCHSFGPTIAQRPIGGPARGGSIGRDYWRLSLLAGPVSPFANKCWRRPPKPNRLASSFS